MALILSLMVIAMLATLGFAAVQQSTLAFSMSRGQIDSRSATLSAQNALTAELALLDTLQVADFSLQGNNGLYRTEAFAALPLWQQQSTWQAGACRLAPHALIGSAAPACAIVELLRYEPDKNYRAFRITVQGYGSTSRSTVLLQAYAVL